MTKDNEIRDNDLNKFFDYDALKSEQRSIVKQRTEEIKERLKRSAQDIWEIGQKLFEVRSRLAYGQFDSWLTAEFGWSRRTAYNFIKVYEAFPERATVAQVSIAASALYQLSSPSTPQKVREDFIQRAKDGEKITRQDIRLASKRKNLAASNTILKPAEPVNAKQKIVAVIPQPLGDIEPSTKTKTIQVASEIISDSIEYRIKSEGWYSLADKHFLFFGDTASAQFHQVLPQVALTIAVTSNDWDHDWLIDKSDNLIVLKEPFSRESISTFISLLSKPDDLVLFPWLPDPYLVELVAKLERTIVAGDSILERCQRAIAVSKMAVEPVLAPQKF